MHKDAEQFFCQVASLYFFVKGMTHKATVVNVG